MADLNRRAVLQGTALIGVAANTPALAVASTRSSVLDDLIGQYRAAVTASDQWHASVYDPAHAAFGRAVEDLPHYTTQATFVGAGGRIQHMSTSCDTARAVVASFRQNRWSFKDDDYGQCLQEIAQAIDEREASLVRLKADHRIAEIDQESDRLTDAKLQALWAVETCPVRSVSDLITKLELVMSEDDDELSGEIVLADLKRIAGRA